MKKPVIDQRLRKPNSDRDLRKISIHVKKRFKERFEYPLSDEELVEIEKIKPKLNGFKWTSSIPTTSHRAIVGIPFVLNITGGQNPAPINIQAQA